MNCPLFFPGGKFGGGDSTLDSDLLIFDADRGT